MIAANDYQVNHNTVRWKGATTNTFTCVWTIIDRARVKMGMDRESYININMVTGVLSKAVDAISTATSEKGEREFVSVDWFETRAKKLRTWRWRRSLGA